MRRTPRDPIRLVVALGGWAVAALGVPTAGQAANEPPLLGDVRIEVVAGVRRTRPWAIQRLMGTRAGEPYDPDTLERDLARLAATGIVYDPESELTSGPQGQFLRLRVKDKWSPLPFLTFRRGGARTTTAFGVWDNNMFGRLFTLSGELNSNADIPFVPRSSADHVGHLVFLIVPRAAATRWSPAFYWSRDFYDFGRWDRGGHRTFVYDRDRQRFLLQNKLELTTLLSISLGAVTYRDDFSRNRVYATATDLPPPSGRSTGAVAEVQFGYMRENVSRFEGKQLVLGVEAGHAGWVGSDASYVTGTASAKGMWVPWPGHNVGGQVVAQATSGRTDSYLARAGGLAEVRGFYDAYFVGQRILRGNLEYRREILELARPLRTVTQVVTFVDGGWVASRADAVAGLDYTGPLVSAGGGLRVNLVPFSKATGRGDLAFGLYPRRRFDIAFGVQQFF